MLSSIARNLRLCWKSLLLTEVVFKTAAFALFTPVVAVLLRLFVVLSGRDILADFDIGYFFLHPLGWLCCVVVGGMALGFLAAEQSALQVIVAAASKGSRITCRQAVAFSCQMAPMLLSLTFRIMTRILIIGGLCVAVIFAVYQALLTEHDINFYLAAKPPQFWIAVSLIGFIVPIFSILLLRLILSWWLALPMVLFADLRPSVALRLSHDRAAGHRKMYLLAFSAWFVANTLLTTALTSLVIWLSSTLVLLASNSVPLLIIAASTVVLLIFAVNVITSGLSSITLAAVMMELYFRTGWRDTSRLPEVHSVNPSQGFRLTWSRLSLALGLGCLTAVIVAIAMLESMTSVDQLQITAHRGASLKAPENTLASVRQAIADQADWIEVDVQQSKDDVLVVAHDRDLKRVAGANLVVGETTAEQLRSLDIGSGFDSAFNQERVPTLSEVLDACKGRAKVYIELKYYGPDRNLEQRVIELVEDRGMQSDVRIISLNLEGLKRVKTLRPNWAVGLLTAVAAGDLTRADVDILAVHERIATRSFVRTAHRNGKDVLVWTINDKNATRTMISRGVDGIITDDPAQARFVLNEQIKMSTVERLLLKLADVLGREPEFQFNVD